MTISSIACGRIGFSPVDGGEEDARPADARSLDARAPMDATDDGHAGADAPDEAGVVIACLPEPMEPWGAPVRISWSMGPGSDDDAALTGDLLELFFTSERAGGPAGFDVFVSLRSSTADDWGDPVYVPSLSTAGYENTLWISRDGLRMYFARSTGASSEDVYYAERPSRTDEWEMATPIAELSTMMLDRGPKPFMGERWIVLHSDRTGTMGSTDFYEASRAAVGDPWGTPVPMVGINTMRQEIQGYTNECGTRTYFNSDRGGNSDFYVAHRAGPGMPFDSVEPIDDLNTAGTEADLVLSSDERYAIFTRQGLLYEVSR